MPLMYCPVDRIIETTLGYTFEFKKDEPVHVPPRAVKAVMERGAVPVDEAEAAEVAKATAVARTAAELEPRDPDVRLAMIRQAILALHKEGTLTYTAIGKPNHNQLSREVKFRVDAAERDEAWAAVMTQVTGS